MTPRLLLNQLNLNPYSTYPAGIALFQILLFQLAPARFPSPVLRILKPFCSQQTKSVAILSHRESQPDSILQRPPQLHPPCLSYNLFISTPMKDVLGTFKAQVKGQFSEDFPGTRGLKAVSVLRALGPWSLTQRGTSV